MKLDRMIGILAVLLQCDRATAPELAARGWDLFTLPSRQGPGAGILFGRKAGEARTVALYLLRSSATLPQDRGLMPSDDEMGEAIAYGVRMELERLRR